MGQKQSIRHINIVTNSEFEASTNQQLLATIYQHKRKLLKLAVEEFIQLNLQPRIGIEIEFYLRNPESKLAINNHLIRDFISKLKSSIHHNGIDILNIEPEQGLGQIEIKTNPYFNLELLCSDIVTIKEITANLAKTFNYQANFSSQPYQNDCGSSLQINFSLVDYQNTYLFAKKHQEGLESEYLLGSVAGLLEFTHNIMIIFAPKTEDYLRFDKEINVNLFKNKKYTAPINISWGYDNRTALVRIPLSKHDYERRLEFRLGASDADIYLSVTFFLLVILEGMFDNKKSIYQSDLQLTNTSLQPISLEGGSPNKFLQTPKSPDISPIFGNAFDEQYLLKTLPHNYQMAENYFWTDNKILERIRRMLLK